MGFLRMNGIDALKKNLQNIKTFVLRVVKIFIHYFSKWDT